MCIQLNLNIQNITHNFLMHIVNNKFFIENKV